jgi:hypothetical protein
MNLSFPMCVLHAPSAHPPLFEQPMAKSTNYEAPNSIIVPIILILSLIEIFADFLGQEIRYTDDGIPQSLQENTQLSPILGHFLSNLLFTNRPIIRFCVL